MPSLRRTLALAPLLVLLAPSRAAAQTPTVHLRDDWFAEISWSAGADTAPPWRLFESMRTGALADAFAEVRGEWDGLAKDLDAALDRLSDHRDDSVAHLRRQLREADLLPRRVRIAFYGKPNQPAFALVLEFADGNRTLLASLREALAAELAKRADLVDTIDLGNGVAMFVRRGRTGLAIFDRCVLLASCGPEGNERCFDITSGAAADTEGGNARASSLRLRVHLSQVLQQAVPPDADQSDAYSAGRKAAQAFVRSLNEVEFSAGIENGALQHRVALHGDADAGPVLRELVADRQLAPPLRPLPDELIQLRATVDLPRLRARFSPSPDPEPARGDAARFDWTRLWHILDGGVSVAVGAPRGGLLPSWVVAFHLADRNEPAALIRADAAHAPPSIDIAGRQAYRLRGDGPAQPVFCQDADRFLIADSAATLRLQLRDDSNANGDAPQPAAAPPVDLPALAAPAAASPARLRRRRSTAPCTAAIAPSSKPA